MEEYDLRLKTPFSWLLAGGSCTEAPGWPSWSELGTGPASCILPPSAASSSELSPGVLGRGVLPAEAESSLAEAVPLLAAAAAWFGGLGTDSAVGMLLDTDSTC